MMDGDGGVFSTLVIDELNQNVKYGPTAEGRWIEIAGWGEQEWEVLVAIASHPRGAHQHDLVRRANNNTVANRKVIFRIRERFRKQRAIPRKHADDVIVTKRLTGAFILNPRIQVRLLSGRLRGTSEFGEARALDSILHAIARAAVEVFGQTGLDKAIALLSEEVRIDTVDTRHPPGRWIPVRYVREWMRAMFNGPAARSSELFERFIFRVESHRVSPYFIDYLKCQNYRLSDIQQMWRTGYDSGDFEAFLSPKRDFFEIRLSNHPYCETEQSRRIFALCWRELSRVFGAKDPQIEMCELEALTGALRIRIRGAFV